MTKQHINVEKCGRYESRFYLIFRYFRNFRKFCAALLSCPLVPQRYYGNGPHMTESFKVDRLWKIKTIVEVALSVYTTTLS